MPTMHAHHFASAADFRALVAAFHDRTLPQGEWTHSAHVAVAVAATLRHGDDAIVHVRAGIRALNAAHGLVETPDRGYHETITRFYMWAVRQRIDGRVPADDASLVALVNDVLVSLDDREMPLRYWSRERLFSPAARAGFVAPDLAPLDWSRGVRATIVTGTSTA